ncbi:hypothetical protein PGT21_007287 [Puccinia graminis f. sp. tritici]|uniref:Uncharacterized protein n=1 Tax=Puccinia graminis f. sp. tritici TaxID=56615 RepID=A0A5B0MIE9_PUCGR|nr:hypothetical protein PGT21_007287 [Puccinia graminis f. sp. tritici]
MLIKKMLCYLGTPSLIWAQAIPGPPAPNPAGSLPCLHVTRSPEQYYRSCNTDYTCCNRHFHTCAESLRVEVQRCTNCNDESNLCFLDRCRIHPTKSCPFDVA